MFAAVALAGLLAASRPQRSVSTAEIDALARAEGNKRGDAVRLGTALLGTTWPAQVLKVRVDGTGSHLIAGLVLSGVKFHGELSLAGFESEVAELVRQSFAAGPLEEVDVWATVPIPVSRLEPVSGDYARPTDRIVFSATVRRADAAAFAARLEHGEGIFWAPDFRARLVAAGGRGPSPGPANPNHSDSLHR